ncbi:MAG TPA: hypothetical protein VN730_14140 [Steroidobacteraceae bacterium]|nr:hypothetical protein [Steroidobacteraceae bacterium]
MTRRGLLVPAVHAADALARLAKCLDEPVDAVSGQSEYRIDPHSSSRETM